MRYVGLMFLGMVLCGGHTTGAAEMTAAESMKVVTNGKVVNQYIQTYGKHEDGLDTVRTTRIIWKGRLYICEDYLVFHEKVTPNQANGQVVAHCFNDEKASK